MSDKEPGKCLPGELSVHELAADDAGAIVGAVMALGSDEEVAGGEAGGEARFPAGSD